MKNLIFIASDLQRSKSQIEGWENIFSDHISFFLISRGDSGSARHLKYTNYTDRKIYRKVVQ